ncbi:hypothetical protein NLX86_22065 [Streptomyces sp. A3M-1-3]|uniref:hypothetical protein n=1 Tax=Streptomyces sp. A3M-1-3 TaxID=2962044 RepID=UPI0020B83BEE|nr:hypothetical protein [Streptomyces sp. A3M-1-3]MCP3820684.1 hypothetical protein [Streptomyces sp. A3M-1-3]
MDSTQQPATQVVVELSGCSAHDAHAVFRVLGRSFASDRTDDDVPHDAAGGRPTVWTSTIDVAELRAEAEPMHLTAPVMAAVQGGYWAVDRLRDVLAAAFAVEDEGMAAGDQEKEVELRLASR